MGRLAVDETVRKLLDTHGPALPVDVERIAVDQGAVIARQPFNGVQSGFALRDGSRWVIGVNTSTSQRRQRFTIAHELGHLLLHEGELIVDHAVRVNWRDQRSSLATNSEEIEANQFAAGLLMPADLVRDVTGELLDAGLRTRDSLVAQLVERFDVSTEAMSYRLVNLGIVAS